MIKAVYCPNCNAPIKGYVSHCPYCGICIDRNLAREEKEEQKEHHNYLLEQCNHEFEVRKLQNKINDLKSYLFITIILAIAFCISSFLVSSLMLFKNGQFYEDMKWENPTLYQELKNYQKSIDNYNSQCYNDYRK